MSKALYDDDGLRRDSQSVRRSARFIQHQPGIWYYEEKQGLYVVIDVEAFPNLHQSRTFIIPRAQILKYAERVQTIPSSKEKL